MKCVWKCPVHEAPNSGDAGLMADLGIVNAPHAITALTIHRNF
jgi:hypothetical protein